MYLSEAVTNGRIGIAGERRATTSIANSFFQHRKYQPFAFTEQGVSMLSAVLRSETAVKVSIRIINAFVAMRRFLSANAQVFQRRNQAQRISLVKQQGW